MKAGVDIGGCQGNFLSMLIFLLTDNELQRITASPPTASPIIEGSAQVNLSELAKKIQTPTLIMHARQDALVPLEEGPRWPV